MSEKFTELAWQFLSSILGNGPLALGWVLAGVLGWLLFKTVKASFDDMRSRTETAAALATALNQLAGEIREFAGKE